LQTLRITGEATTNLTDQG